MLSTRGLLVTLLASTFVAACSGGGGDGPADPGGPGPGPGGVVDLAATVDGPAAATGGERVTVRWSIRNVGEVASGWYAELRFGHAATPWEQREVADRLFGVMGTAPGETDSVTSELTSPPGSPRGRTSSRCA